MNFAVILTGAIMLAALFGMIVCAKKQQTNPKAQPLAIALLLVVIVCGVVILFQTNVFGDGGAAVGMAREVAYAKAKGVVTGKYLAQKVPGAKILVVMQKGWEKNDREKAQLDGLKEGLGSSAIEVIPEVPEITMPKGVPGMPGGPGAPGGPDAAAQEEMMMMMPMMELMTAKNFDDLLAKHPDCNVVVSFVGLPRRDTAAMKLWKMPADKRPKVVLLGGDVHSIKKAILAKMILAVVAYKPNPDFDEKDAPSDPQKAFDKRFLLITTDNIQEIIKKYPKGLFAK